MKKRNEIQLAFDDYMQSINFSKKAGSWYRHGHGVITVVNLQRSQYGPLYFVDLALWLTSLGEERYPKVHDCHVRARLEGLVKESEQAAVEKLLNMESEMGEMDRIEALARVFNTSLQPALDVATDLQLLQSDSANELLGKCLVRGPAQGLLFAAR